MTVQVQNSINGAPSSVNPSSKTSEIDCSFLQNNETEWKFHKVRRSASDKAKSDCFFNPGGPAKALRQRIDVEK